MSQDAVELFYRWYDALKHHRKGFPDDDLLLVIEDPDPWAQDDEPIFWTD